MVKQLVTKSIKMQLTDKQVDATKMANFTILMKNKYRDIVVLCHSR